jgi:hypothetical protein
VKIGDPISALSVAQKKRRKKWKTYLAFERGKITSKPYPSATQKSRKLQDKVAAWRNFRHCVILTGF